MRRVDAETTAIAMLVSSLLQRDYLPGAALKEAERMWSEIKASSEYGSAADEDLKSDYDKLFTNLYVEGLRRGLSTDAALNYAKDAADAVLRHLNPDDYTP